MKEVKIRSIIKSSLAIYHKEGEEIFDLLQKEIDKEKLVRLSFKKMKRCSMQFLNASIGRIYLLNDEEVASRLLVYDYGDLSDFLSVRLKEVIDNAISQKKNVLADGCSPKGID